MKLDRVIAVRNNKTIYRDGDRCVKVFNERYCSARHTRHDRYPPQAAQQLSSPTYKNSCPKGVDRLSGIFLFANKFQFPVTI